MNLVRAGVEPAVRKVNMPRRRLVFVVAAMVASALVASPQSVSASPGVPSAPKAVKALPGNHSARVSWLPPFSNGGHKVTGYRVIAYHDDVALAVNVFNSTATAQTMLGLKNGESYSFTVGAENSTGWSRSSSRRSPPAARSPPTSSSVPTAPMAPRSSSRRTP